MPRFSWTTDIEQAESEQRTLRELVSLNTALAPSLEFGLGLAIGTAYDTSSKRCYATAIRFDQTGRYWGRVTEASLEVDFPYIPGLLVFRVGPAICALLDTVVEEIDLLLFDGQGVAHPRGLGLAAHIGVLYDKPSIGMTRNSLYGVSIDPPKGRFNRSDLLDPRTGVVIGYSMSFGGKCEPCYVSPGHRLSLEDAYKVVCRIAGEGACFPRSLQRAHAHANRLAKTHRRT